MNAGAKSLTVLPSVHPSKQVLWIRTAAGPEIGFGHLYRCFTLAEALHDVCAPVFLLDPDDVHMGEQILKRGWRLERLGLAGSWTSLPDPAGILIDTRVTRGIDEFISTAKSHGVPVISLHDFGLAPINSDIAVDGSAVPVPEDAYAFSNECFLGTDYMVLNPVYARLNGIPKQIQDEIRTVFINLGGGNSVRHFGTLLSGLRRWGKSLDVIGVPGFVSQGQERLSCRDWSPLQFRWESEHLEEFLLQADFAITAGGISAYEALCTGTPMAAVSYDALQQRTISELAARHACISLGPAELLDPADLARTVSTISHDLKKRKSLSDRARQLVDGRGAERVSKIIRQTIENYSTAVWERADVAGACI